MCAFLYVEIHERSRRYTQAPGSALTLDGVAEALGGGRVVGRRVEGGDLQAVGHVLGLGQALHHGAVDVPRRVPPDWVGLSV